MAQPKQTQPPYSVEISPQAFKDLQYLAHRHCYDAGSVQGWAIVEFAINLAVLVEQSEEKPPWIELSPAAWADLKRLAAFGVWQGDLKAILEYALSCLVRPDPTPPPARPPEVMADQAPLQGQLPLTVRLPAEELAQLEALALQSNRSLREVVRDALRAAGYITPT